MKVQDLHGRKHVVCPKCGQVWHTGVRGGGLKTGAAIRHIEKCQKPPLTEEELRAILRQLNGTDKKPIR